ncbi:putative tetratricopeptide-like helical domain-containing protein [Medicago truncatula]|uniref:PPR containing plant-like protein n=1 Tax=Medicago truncatula TaxID=3880 RepID=G7JJ20_MEDTR|nr:pentatricopeptide repeat-containing protein At2g36980, mitochondrial [Medicago truncatula]AES91770.2 PPR containing plant-like protein [Medicago truncatula]RHN64212.1 putative tetratricopeptide-like helical domain-containing protein [Medicago truncatula]
MRPCLIRATSEIVSLARSGRICHARKLFDEMPERDTVAWNAMLTAYSRLGLYQQTFDLFDSMRRISDSKPDNFSYSAAINSCAGASDIRFGTKLHSLVVVSGYQSSLPVANALIDMYGKCFNPNDARKVFDEMNYSNEVTWCSLLFAYANTCRFDMAFEIFRSMPEKVEIAWNIIIAAHARCGEVEACLHLFKEMCENLYQPDQWTFSALMSACTESMESLHGCMMHCFVIKSGWSTAMEVNNSIVSFYAKLECHGDAVKVFNSGGAFNQVSWNAIIDAHMKVGDTQKALLAFQQAPEKNIVSWTSMIVGYTRNGNGDLALSLFLDMKRNSFQLDDLVAGAVLHACASLAILVHGKMVHSCIIHLGLDKYLFVGNSLINMYAKCGDIEGSKLALRGINDKDLVSWNSMLFAFGLNGRGNEAICMFREMVASGVRPDEVTFTGLLMTCSHLGLIDEGFAFFQSMSLEYGLVQGMDHVACMVDMLGRGGYVAEAQSLARKYSKTSRDKTNSCEVLLGACHAHGDLGTGSSVGEYVKNLEPKKEVGYVLLSNMYCASGKWKEAEMVRKEMMDQGVKKVPGCSWIEIRNVVTAFVSGNNLYPCMADISKILYFLELEMRHTRPINFDIE